MTIFWLAAFIVFAIGEAVTVGLVSVWFAVGALAGLFATALGAGLWLQITVFLGVSALALALFKPLSSKLLKTKASATNADRVIGASALVTLALFIRAGFLISSALEVFCTIFSSLWLYLFYRKQLSYLPPEQRIKEVPPQSRA